MKNKNLYLTYIKTNAIISIALSKASFLIRTQKKTRNRTPSLFVVLLVFII